MSKTNDSKKRNIRMVVDIQRTTDPLTRKDIADWRAAWQMAINADNPSRIRLYDIYNDVQADSHLSGCVEQRRGFVMARSFKIVDDEDDGQEEALHYFNQSWFKDFERLVLDSIYWSHSLIELGDITTDGDGCICYSGVRLIPRKHVLPEFGRVVLQQYQDWHTGIDYRSRPFSDWLIEAGRPDDLGLYLKAAVHTIPKKNMLAFWDTFGEIFGMPIRVARTSSRDPKVRNEISDMLKQAGAAGSVITDPDTEIEFIENAKADAYQVYNQRVDRCNSELSKLIIGQTMTIEDGSSLSQSETHLKVFQNLVESDSDMLRDVINNQLIPRMVRHGFPVAGLRFDWDYSVDYTPEQQVAYETLVADRYEVDPSYFAEKYSMPVGERRNQQLMFPDSSGEDKVEKNPKKPDPSKDGKEEKGKDDKKKQKNAHPFFD